MRSRVLDSKGFTIPELLVVMAFFCLFGIGSYFLLKPADFSDQHADAARMLDTAQLTRAIVKYYNDHGELPSGITDKITTVGNGTDELNLCSSLVPQYLKDLPADPQWGIETVKGDCKTKNQHYLTSYQVRTINNGKTLVVSAPLSATQLIRIERQLQN